MSIETRGFQLASFGTSRFPGTLGRLVVGQRDQYVHWKRINTPPADVDLIETPGDPEVRAKGMVGKLPRSQERAMVLGTDWVDLRDGVEYGFDAAAVIRVGGELLAGKFLMGDRAPSAEGGPDQAQIAPGIGGEALSATIALVKPDDTLMPLETQRVDPAQVEGGVSGVPYADLRERFPQAVWL